MQEAIAFYQDSCQKIEWVDKEACECSDLSLEGLLLHLEAVDVQWIVICIGLIIEEFQCEEHQNSSQLYNCASITVSMSAWNLSNITIQYKKNEAF